MGSQSFKLIGDQQREAAAKACWLAPSNFVARIAAETRRDAQNRKLWPMLKDVQRDAPGLSTFTTNDIKLQCLNALGTELRFLPLLEGEGSFPVGLSSSSLTVAQFAGLVDLIYEFGGRKGVRWSEPMDRGQ